MKIGPVDPEIFGLQWIIKNKKKEITQTEHIACGRDTPHGLNEMDWQERARYSQPWGPDAIAVTFRAYVLEMR